MKDTVFLKDFYARNSGSSGSQKREGSLQGRTEMQNAAAHCPSLPLPVSVCMRGCVACVCVCVYVCLPYLTCFLFSLSENKIYSLAAG